MMNLFIFACVFMHNSAGDSRQEAVALLSEIESSRCMLTPIQMEIKATSDDRTQTGAGGNVYTIYTDGLRAIYEMRMPPSYLPDLRPLNGEADSIVTWDGFELRQRNIKAIVENRNMFNYYKLPLQTGFTGAFSPNPVGLDLPNAPAPYHLNLNRNLFLYQDVQGLEAIPETGEVKVFIKGTASWDGALFDVELIVDPNKGPGVREYSITLTRGGDDYLIKGISELHNYNGTWFPQKTRREQWRNGEFMFAHNYEVLSVQFGVPPLPREEYGWEALGIQAGEFIHDESEIGAPLLMWDGAGVVPAR